jgi:hypothetical protein
LCFLNFELREWTAAWQSSLWLHACTLQSGLSHNNYFMFTHLKKSLWQNNEKCCFHALELKKLPFNLKKQHLHVLCWKTIHWKSKCFCLQTLIHTNADNLLNNINDFTIVPCLFLACTRSSQVCVSEIFHPDILLHSITSNPVRFSLNILIFHVCPQERCFGCIMVTTL